MTGMNHDRQLQKCLLDELDFEPRVDSSHIGVTVTDGIVTLSGHVPSFSQKTAAERAAWRVRGVKAVVQNIDVHHASDALADEEIAKRALGVLRWDTTVPDSVHLQVDNGWITLAGEVDWQYQLEGAERRLRSLKGVTGISNLIALRSRPTPSTVRECILAALKRNAEVEAGRIAIDVADGGAVTLEGTVSNWAERIAVKRAAWSSAGVKSVVDRLEIR